MIKFDELYTLIEKLDVPCIKITDYANNIIMRFENSNSAIETINEIKQVEPMLQSYGKIIVHGGTAAECKANYRGSYKWNVGETKTSTPAVINGAPGNFFNAPPGYIHQDLMAAKLEAIQKDIQHEREIRTLTEKKGFDFEKMIPFIPAIMSGLGFADEKVNKVIQYSKISQGSNAMGEIPTNTLTFKDVEKLSAEEKNKKIQTSIDSLSEKISAEHFVLLLEYVDKNPALADLIGSLNGKVNPSKFITLLEAINKNPALVEKAVNFLPML